MKKHLHFSLLVLTFTFFQPASFVLANSTPVVLNGIGVNLQPNGTALVPASCFLASDLCSVDDVRINRAVSGAPGNEPPLGAGPLLAVNCDDLGIVLVHIWVRNFLGQWSVFETYLIVQDNLDICGGGSSTIEAPVVQAIVGLTFSPDGGADIQIQASDFVAAYTLPNGGTAQFSFSADPTDNTRTLSCSDVGLTKIYNIYIHDDQGSLSTFTETYAQLTDPSGVCNAGNSSESFATYNGLVYSLPPQQQIVLRASDFVPCCGDGKTYAFSEDPADSLLVVDCTELSGGVAQLLVDIFGFVPDGSYSASTTYVLLQDNYDYCTQTGFTPSNDEICDAIALPVTGCPLVGTNIGATAQAGEPSPPDGDCSASDAWCDGQGAEQSVWYTFEAPASGSVRIHANYFNTQMALWEAESCQAATTGGAILVAANDDAGGSGLGEAALEAGCLIPGKTYYLQVDGYAGATGTFELLLEDAGLNCLTAGDNPECMSLNYPSEVTGHQGWRHFFDDNLGLIASIAEMGNELGSVDISYQTNDGDIRMDGTGQPYLDRNWAISVEHPPASPVRLRLYFSEAEFQALQSAGAGIENLEDLYLTRVPDGTCGPYSIGGELYPQLASGPFNEQGFYADFEIPGFSAFYLNGSEGLVSGTDTQDENKTFQLYPNPAGAAVWINLELGRSAETSVRCFNLQGQLVSQSQHWMSAGNNRLLLSLAGLPAGVYTIAVEAAGQVWKTRLVRLP